MGYFKNYLSFQWIDSTAKPLIFLNNYFVIINLDFWNYAGADPTESLNNYIYVGADPTESLNNYIYVGADPLLFI